MAVEIDIDNNRVVLSDVATEETLKRLVAAVEKASPGGSAGGAFVSAQKEAIETTKKSSKQQKTLQVGLKGLTKSADDLAHEMDEAADAAGGFASKAMGMATKIADAAESVVKFGASTARQGLKLEQVGGFVESMGNKLPIVGGALGAMGGVVIAQAANLNDSFNQLTRSGAAFSGNMFDIERAAANSYLTLEQFGGIIRENSASLAVFGGTAALGAKRFSNINQELQTTSRERLRYLGITAEESAELLGEYITMQQRNTSFAMMSTKQQSLAAANFSEEITKLATLTGQDRKALAEKMAREKQASDIELQLSEMSAKGNTDTRASLELLKNKFGEVPGAMDLIIQGMRGYSVGATDEGRKLSTSPFGQTLNELGQKMKDGTVTQEEVIKALNGAYSEHTAQFKNMYSQAGYNDYAKLMADAGYALQGFQQTANGVTNKMGDIKIPVPDPTESTKAVKDAQMMIEDMGKTARLGINTVTEGVVDKLGPSLSSLKEKIDNFDISDPGTKEAVENFKTGANAAGGAAAGLAKAAKKAADTLLSIAKGGADDVAKSLAQSTGTELAKKGAAAAGSGVLKSSSSLLSKIPILGALFSGGVTYATSDQDTQTGKMAEAAGSAAGSWGGAVGGAAAGAAIGSVVPIVGTAIGGVIGGILGGIGGDMLGKKVFGGIADAFGFESGGIIRQPTLSMIGEGSQDEAVVPLPNNRNIPVDIDLSAIDNLTKSVEKLVQLQGINSSNSDVVEELRKLNRQTGRVITLQS